MTNWTIVKNVIIAITLLFLLVSEPGLERIHAHRKGIQVVAARQLRLNGLGSNSIRLAQNKTETSKEGERATVENENTSAESTSTAKEGSGTTPREAETKQVKPFKPSEEIAAEQAVDFPWDI